MSMQDALMAQYSRPEFQAQLWAAMADAGADQVKQTRARQELCLPIQGPIISQFGFEASRRGVALSVAAFAPLNGDPEIDARNSALAVLVNPQLQKPQKSLQPEKLPAAGRPAAAAQHEAPVEAAAQARQAASLWKVVGGASSGGVVVRRGRDLTSVALARLSTGAEVEEVDVEGDRLHYRKLRGDGPEFGWVSLSVKGSPLMERMQFRGQ